jgi:hypothetical protein
MNIADAARNPLGVIGLFISLIYGFANWMLGSSVSALQSTERLIIIWFIVIFPVLILATFCYLVVKHHGKLYAPKDYKKDESFLQTLSDFDGFVRLSAETDESQQNVSGDGVGLFDIVSEPPKDEASGEIQTTSGEQPRPTLDVGQDASSADAALDIGGSLGGTSPATTPMLPEENDLDLIEHAKRSKQIAKMKELLELTRYFIKVDSRFVGADVRTNAKMGATGIVYDAAAYTDSGLQCLEVKYLKSTEQAKRMLVKYLNQVRAVQSAISPAEFHLRLVLVHDWDLNFETQLRKVLASMRPSFQGLLSVDLVPRESINV